MADIVSYKKSDFYIKKFDLDTNFMVDSNHIKEVIMFKLVSNYKPSGDQPNAINELVKGINEGKKHQVLLGATGTGKTL